MRTKQLLLIGFLGLIFIKISGQKIVYHHFYETASSYNVVEWNISNQEEKKTIIKETVDENNRVIMLEFLSNGKLFKDHLCYLPNKVIFEYKENCIIETLWSGDNVLIANECEMPYKSIYYLNSDTTISKILIYYKIDTINYSQKEVESLRNYIPDKREVLPSENKNLEISFYYHSFYKLNFPACSI